MKRLLTLLLSITMLFTACTSTAKKWQEHYDLGMRYLSEGNYKEAIIAFNAAIEIDEKQVDAYIGLADAYIAQGDTEKAIEALEKGYRNTNDESINERIEKLKKKMEYGELLWSYITYEPWFDGEYAGNGKIVHEYYANDMYVEAVYDGYGIFWYENHYECEVDGNTVTIYFGGRLNMTQLYDENRNLVTCTEVSTDKSGDVEHVIYEYDTDGYIVKETHYNGDNSISKYEINSYYDNKKLKTWESALYDEDGLVSKLINEYNEKGIEIKEISLNEKYDSSNHTWVFEHDESGNRTIETIYNHTFDGAIKYYTVYRLDVNGNRISEEMYDKNNVLEYVVVREYDGEGEPSKDTRTDYNEDGSVEEIEITIWQNRKGTITRYNADGTVKN